MQSGAGAHAYTVVQVMHASMNQSTFAHTSFHVARYADHDVSDKPIGGLDLHGNTPTPRPLYFCAAVTAPTWLTSAQPLTSKLVSWFRGASSQFCSVRALAHFCTASPHPPARKIVMAPPPRIWLMACMACMLPVLLEAVVVVQLTPGEYTSRTDILKCTRMLFV